MVDAGAPEGGSQGQAPKPDQPPGSNNPGAPLRSPGINRPRFTYQTESKKWDTFDPGKLFLGYEPQLRQSLSEGTDAEGQPLPEASKTIQDAFLNDPLLLPKFFTQTVKALVMGEGGKRRFTEMEIKKIFELGSTETPTEQGGETPPQGSVPSGK